MFNKCSSNLTSHFPCETLSSWKLFLSQQQFWQTHLHVIGDCTVALRLLKSACSTSSSTSLEMGVSNDSNLAHRTELEHYGGVHAVVWIWMAHIGSYIWMFGHLGKRSYFTWQRLGGVASHWEWALRFQMLKLILMSISFPAACHSGCRTLSFLSNTMSVCMLPWFLPLTKMN